MECPAHPNTELMCRLAGITPAPGGDLVEQILYCPHCARDLYRRKISPDGTHALEPV